METKPPHGQRIHSTDGFCGLGRYEAVWRARCWMIGVEGPVGILATALRTLLGASLLRASRHGDRNPSRVSKMNILRRVIKNKKEGVVSGLNRG